MAKVQLTSTSLGRIKTQISRMQSEVDNAQSKVVSALNGLDFEVSSKRNIENSLNKIRRGLDKQSGLAIEYKTAFINATNGIIDADNKYGADSHSILDKIQSYVENILIDITDFFTRNKIAKYGACSGLFLAVPGVLCFVSLKKILETIVNWFNGIFNNESNNEPVEKPEVKPEVKPEPEPEPEPTSKLTPEQQAMVDRLRNSTTPSMSSKKRETLAKMAETLLAEGYEPAFVAGVLGNIKNEGSCGQFENSNYGSRKKPAYLQYADDHYDYTNKYSNKSVEDVSLSELYKMVCEMEASGRSNAFGLGCAQWTSINRNKMLIETYMEVAAPNDRITTEQIYEAEALMISRELKGKHNYIYQDWKNNNASNLNSANAANSAGSIVCKKYERPADMDNKAIVRGNDAQSIYNVMMG